MAKKTTIIVDGSFNKELEDVIIDKGGEGVKVFADFMADEVKKRIPILGAYGVANRERIPHKNKAAPGEIKESTKVIESQKYLDSYLINVRDWRARFLEYGVKAHTMPRNGKTRKRKYAFLATDGSGNIVFRGKINHPGMKGAGFLQQSMEDSVINGCLEKTVSKLNTTL